MNRLIAASSLLHSVCLPLVLSYSPSSNAHCATFSWCFFSSQFIGFSSASTQPIARRPAFLDSFGRLWPLPAPFVQGHCTSWTKRQGCTRWWQWLSQRRASKRSFPSIIWLDFAKTKNWRSPERLDSTRLTQLTLFSTIRTDTQKQKQKHKNKKKKKKKKEKEKRKKKKEKKRINIKKEDNIVF